MIYVSVGRYNMLMSVFVQFDNKYDVELYLCASVCEYDPLCVCHHKRTHTTDEVNQKIEKTITFKWGLGWKEGQRYLCLHTQS